MTFHLLLQILMVCAAIGAIASTAVGVSYAFLKFVQFLNRLPE